MSDLISREAAIEEVETRLKAAYVWYDNSVLKDDYALSVKAEGAISAFIECVLMLKGLPSAEPEIIRCRDCKYYQTKWETSFHNRHYCATMDSMMPADGFCCYAERRTDEAD